MNIVKTQYKNWKIYDDKSSGLWTADNDISGEQVVCPCREALIDILDEIDVKNT